MVLSYYGFKVFGVLRFEGFNVLGFKGYSVSRFQGFNVVGI